MRSFGLVVTDGEAGLLLFQFAHGVRMGAAPSD